jgi:hypothetical protein
MSMSGWHVTSRSVFGAAACLLFAIAILVAPFDELARYERNGRTLFRDLDGSEGEGLVRVLLALLFLGIGVYGLRARRSRRRQ